MLDCQFSDLTSARRAADKTLFDKEGFVNLFKCTRIFTDGCGNRTYADRSAFEFVDNRQQDLIIRIVEAVTIDVERFQSKVCEFRINCSRALYLRTVAHTALECFGNTRNTLNAS